MPVLAGGVKPSELPSTPIITQVQPQTEVPLQAKAAVSPTPTKPTVTPIKKVSAAQTASSKAPAPTRAPAPAIAPAPVQTIAPSTQTPAPLPPPTTAPAPQPQPEPVKPTVVSPQPTSYAQAIEQEVLRLTNSERVQAGLPALTLDTRLSNIGREHSVDMAVNNYFAHATPSGCSSACRAAAAGYSYQMIGENIFMFWGETLTVEQAAQKIVTWWMQSPAHRDNILKPGYTMSGTGVYAVGDKVYATAMYSLPR
jgi:uncharacterized protein YkwD